MSTFNPPADIAQITLAKSSDVNAIKAATAIAFGLLPNESKLQRGTVNFAVDTGTANSYVVALDASITSYTDGLQVVFRPLNDNTGSATINLNSLGAKSIRLTDSQPIQAGDISAGAVIDVRYSTATGFFHLTPNSAIYAYEAGTSATAAAASASAASTSASNASTSATNAASSATAASTSASNASTSASTATTQAGIATTQAGLATTNGAAQVALATAQVALAADQVTLATTQATNAVTSATNAANSALAASTSASNASASASTATTQASNASTSATNAASSATSAAASYDSFDDRYLGAKSSDPSVDNDGNALLTGALYWNTASSEMRVYSGSAWVTAYLPAAGYLALSGGTMTGNITFAAGSLGVGSTDLSRFAIHIAKNITGNATSYGILNDAVIQSDVTINAFYNRTGAATAAAAFTLTGLTHYDATQNAFGATSAVTNQYGFSAGSTLTGATNNYGFFGNIAAGTGRYNLYMAGTADNYLAGSLGIGAIANASALLDVQSTTKGVRMPNMTTTQKNAISSPAAGLMVFDTTLSKICVYTGAAWTTLGTDGGTF
jgi:hypothetical protein